FCSALEQAVSEFTRRVGGLGATPEFRFQLDGVLLTHVPLEEHLHGKLAGFAAEGHATYAATFGMREFLVQRRRIFRRRAFARDAPFRWRRDLLQNLCCRP